MEEEFIVESRNLKSEKGNVGGERFIMENKIIDFLERHFVPLAGKVGSQRHIKAIRDGV